MPPVREPLDLPFAPVSRATVQDHVYERLRNLIVTGGIEPGRTVTVQSLAEAFGVSAMPVREAMHRLVAEKALVVVGGRSVGTPPLTQERLEDLRRVRVEIEGTGAYWAAQSITEGDLASLSAILQEMVLANAEGDRKRYVPANRDFHFTIYRATGSEVLLSIIESLWLQIGPYFNLLNAVDNWSSAIGEHEAALAALRRHDGAAARKAIQADIDGAASALSGLLTQTKPATARLRISRTG